MQSKERVWKSPSGSTPQFYAELVLEDEQANGILVALASSYRSEAEAKKRLKAKVEEALRE